MFNFYDRNLRLMFAVVQTKAVQKKLETLRPGQNFLISNGINDCLTNLPPRRRKKCKNDRICIYIYIYIYIIGWL